MKTGRASCGTRVWWPGGPDDENVRIIRVKPPLAEMGVVRQAQPPSPVNLLTLERLE
jgi:hypothetical protein